MKLTDEEFEELKKLQNMINSSLQDYGDKRRVLDLCITGEQLDIINEALIDSIEAEMDRRRKNDKIKSIVEQVLEKPVPERLATKLELKGSCKYELPCGRCDLTKSLCSYNYEVKTDGNDI